MHPCSQVWQHTSVIPAYGTRQKRGIVDSKLAWITQSGHRFKASLEHTVGPCLPLKQNTKKRAHLWILVSV